MENETRRQLFICATMQIVAENGLGGFSVKQVTDKLGVSEALIYKYFRTKDNLLYACFESVHKDIAALFHGFAVPPIVSAESFYATVRSLWLTYFDFLVKSDYKTVYYFDYRDSSYAREIVSHDDEARNTYFKDFAEIMHILNAKFHFAEKYTEAHLWTYILDTSGIFAKRVIRGDLPRTEQSYEQIWRLIFGGIASVMR